jgi:leader peptidase (prepilin peptidase)/N-methyltransferase
MLLRLSKEDLKHRRLPNRQVAVVALLGLATVIVECVQTSQLSPLPQAALGAVYAAAPALLCDTLYYTVRHEHGFGAGDIKLLAALGIWLGPIALYLLPLACLDALPFILFLQKKQADTRKAQKHIAFGPFISFAAVVLVIVDLNSYFL